MLDSTMPCYQLGLGSRLCYEITFNDYNRVTLSGKPDAKYKIADVSLEYEIVTQLDIARCIAMEYQSMALPYNRVLRDRQIPVNKSDKAWSWSFNKPCRS